MTRLYSLLLIAFLALAPGAFAQTLDITDSEEVAIAFYKTAGLRPSFMSWAEDTKTYHLTPVARREEVQREEAERLSRAYDKFSQARSLLNVSTAVLVTLEEQPHPESADKKQYFMGWWFERSDADFFPYEYRDTYFALVPRDLKLFQRAEIGADQYAHLMERLKYGPRATAIIQLRADHADAKAPVSMRGRDFWALSAKVAGVSLWDKTGTILWENTAGWYVSPRTQSLNELRIDKKASE